MMRLWHKNLIPYLPRQQLLGQWRECCCIAKSIAEKGTPNHILVNKIMDYPIEHFIRYTIYVQWYMLNRGYKLEFEKFTKYFDFAFEDYEKILTIPLEKYLRSGTTIDISFNAFATSKKNTIVVVLVTKNGWL